MGLNWNQSLTPARAGPSCPKRAQLLLPFPLIPLGQAGAPQPSPTACPAVVTLVELGLLTQACRILIPPQKKGTIPHICMSPAQCWGMVLTDTPRLHLHPGEHSAAAPRL